MRTLFVIHSISGNARQHAPKGARWFDDLKSALAAFRDGDLPNLVAIAGDYKDMGSEQVATNLGYVVRIKSTS
jgi:hypothetical protein